MPIPPPEVLFNRYFQDRFRPPVRPEDPDPRTYKGGRDLDKVAPQGDRVPTATDCYRFVMSNPAIDVYMTGPAKEQHVREAIQTLDRGPMNEEELAWMRRVGQAIHAK